MGLFSGPKRKQRLENPRVVLTLQVTRPTDLPPFEVSTKRTVSRVAIPRAGDSLVVRYDPVDPENFAIGPSTATIDAADAGTIAAAVSAAGRPIPTIRSTCSRLRSRLSSEAR